MTDVGVLLGGVVPEKAVGLCLYRIDRKERLLGCDPVRFVEGWDGVERTLRLARISGRVEIGGCVENHFADVLDDDETILETVALDATSYGALKNHWMRCSLSADTRQMLRALSKDQQG